MGTPFNKLTPAEAERHALLAEEAGEIVQAVTKVLRHGRMSSNPFAQTAETNRYALAREIGNLLAALDIAVAGKDVDMITVMQSRDDKLRSINRWLHHNHITVDADGVVRLGTIG